MSQMHRRACIALAVWVPLLLPLVSAEAWADRFVGGAAHAPSGDDAGTGVGTGRGDGTWTSTPSQVEVPGAPRDVAVGGSSGVGGPALNLAVSIGSVSIHDPSRSTPARGSVAGHPGRDLPTTLWYPSSGGPWPLVVFAHGYNTNPGAYATLCSYVASQGYVVAAPALPGSRNDMPGTPTRDIPSQPLDLSAVIDSVLSQSASATSFLFGRVDTSRVGAMGHSDGAIAVAALAMNTATVDSRVRAAAVLSGGLWSIPGGAWGSVQPGAVLVAHGDADPIAAYSEGIAAYDGAHAPRAFLTALGGGHELPYTGSSAQAAAMRASIGDFFDLELRGDLAGASRLFKDGNQAGLDSITRTDGISASPTGHLDSAARAGNQSVRLVGWIIDPDTDDPVVGSVSVDGREVGTLVASSTRSELPFFFPSFSAAHGFDASFPAGAGTHSFCVRARNVGNGSDAVLGCRSVSVFPQVFGGPVVANFDGRLEVFATDAGGTLRHSFQQWPGGGWDSWYPLSGATLAGTVSTATNSDGRLEAFSVGSDSRLWHVWQVCPGCGWSSWYPLAGEGWQPGLFSVAANSDGRLEVFAVGSDGALRHVWQPAAQSGWSEWYSMQAPGFAPAASPIGVAAARQADGRLVVAWVDPAGQLALDAQQAPGVGWDTWRSLGGGISGTPVLGVNQDLRLEVFAAGADGQAWHAYQWASGWSPTAPLGGLIDPSRKLASANEPDQRLVVFGSTPSGGPIVALGQLSPNGGWGGPHSLGGSGGDLASAVNPDGRVEVFTAGLPVTHAFELDPGGGWSPWYLL